MTISAPRATAAVLAAAMLSALAACSGGSSNGAAGAGTGGGSAGGRVASRAVLVGEVEPLNPGTLTASQVAADDTAFGFDLFHSLCTAQPNTNLTISPASAAQALGMLDAGSSGHTRAAVSALLHLPGWNGDLVAALHAQQASLSQIAQLKVSNHVFEQKGLAPTRQTLNDLRTAYDADLRQLDFGDEPAATNAINAVISDDTDKLIPTLFGQPLDPATRTVLANAILLDAKWRQQFPAAKPGTFHTAAGGSVTTPTMRNPEANFAARTADGWQSVVLPYVGGLQAVAMLPPADSGCDLPTPSTLQSLTSGSSQQANVSLPKLNLSQTLPLTGVLAKLGLPLRGNYTGLGASDDEVSQVVQKVVMKVDEKGTKAAAATGIGVTTLALQRVTVVNFDRPFVLLVEDAATHTPLFLTRVADPTQR